MGLEGEIANGIIHKITTKIIKGGAMEQVAKLLEDFDLGGALVRLWVMAGDSQRLNEWEHDYDVASNDGFMRDFQEKINHNNTLSIAVMNANAIALIRAIDILLASNSARSRLLRSYKIGENHYWLFRQLADWRAKTATRGQPGSLLAWFSHHSIIPAQTTDKKIDIKLYQCDGDTAEFLMRMLKNPTASIKIWIGHFADGADVQWDKPHPIQENCRTTEVTDAKTRVDSLLKQLVRAKNAGANFIVFPEFSLDIAQRKEVRLWLKSNECPHLLYIVPGSFHELQAGTTPEKYFNTAPLFDAEGNVVFTHQKLRLFGKNRVAENVSVGRTLHVLATPIGCLTVLICKDFMDKDASVASLLQHVLVDWVLVPSFGDESTINGHQVRARELAKIVSGTNSAVANARNTAMHPDGGNLPGFGHRSQEDKSTPVPETGCIVEFLLPHCPPSTTKHKKNPYH
jgi:predicted amidohydrolase